MTTLLPLAQNTTKPLLTKSQLALLKTMALPHVTHLMIGFRGAFIGGLCGGEGGRVSNATAKVLMRTVYLTRHLGRGTSNESFYTISSAGLEYLASSKA